MLREPDRFRRFRRARQTNLCAQLSQLNGPHGCVQRPGTAAVTLADSINSSTFAFPQIVSDIAKLASDQTFAAYPALMRDTFKYLSKLGDRGAKPNYEKHLAARFAQTHARVQSAIKKAHIPVEQARMLCAFPLGGVQDNTVNRLLLMSNSERHLPSARWHSSSRVRLRAISASGPIGPMDRAASFGRSSDDGFLY
jgi:hypothetical protein